MISRIKQFINNIDTTSLIPMAVFVSIVAFLLWPFKTLSSTAALPCTMLAKSFCMFAIGCYIAEILKGRISRRICSIIGVIGLIFALHLLTVDGVASLCNTPPVSIGWYPYKYVILAGANPFFLCLGIIINHYNEDTHDRPHPFRNYGHILTDICLAIFVFLMYMISMYVMSIPTIFEDPVSNLAWVVRYIIRIACFPVWVVLMVYLYRCLTSNWALTLKDRFPRLLRFFAYLAPIGILFVLFNSTRQYSIWLWYDIISYPLLAYTVVVTFRFTIRLLRTLISKDFGWKEIFLGDLK